MRHPQTRRHNITSTGPVARSGERPPAGTALQPANRAGLSQLDTVLHPRQRQARSGADGQAEVEAFLTRLATDGQVSAGTQNQALAALLFLYREVLRIELPCMENLVRAKRPIKEPTLLQSLQQLSRPTSPCRAPRLCPRWSPAAHTPSAPW